jgi:hypothetical protein
MHHVPSGPLAEEGRAFLDQDLTLCGPLTVAPPADSSTQTLRGYAGCMPLRGWPQLSLIDIEFCPVGGSSVAFWGDAQICGLSHA